MSKLLEDARAEAVMWRERCKVAEAQRDEAKAARDTTRATGETAMLTRKEYAERINDAYFDQGMGMATRDVLMHHDAAFRERDERQRERIVKLRAAIEGAPHAQDCHLAFDREWESSHADRCTNVSGAPPCLGCDCWKAAALADEKEENRG